MYDPQGLTLGFFSGGKKAHHCWSRQGSKGKRAAAAAELWGSQVYELLTAYIPSPGGACTILDHKQQQLFASSSCWGWGWGQREGEVR